MYPNLNAELARKGWTRKELAKVVKMRYYTLIDKLNGKYPMSLEEAVKIKEAMGVDLPIETLFFNK